MVQIEFPLQLEPTPDVDLGRRGKRDPIVPKNYENTVEKIDKKTLFLQNRSMPVTFGTKGLRAGNQSTY